MHLISNSHARIRAALVSTVTVLALLTLAGSALAASVGPYGEAFRGGGFDACWYDNGNYDGQGAANGVSGCAHNESYPGQDSESQGKFVNPVGFAVGAGAGAGAGDLLFVLDRTSALPSASSGLPAASSGGGHETTWRLQELSSTGSVLGSDVFSLPADDNNLVTGPGSGNPNGYSDFEIAGLAVDPSLNRIYALLVAFDPNAPVSPLSGPTDDDVVDEILAWSITPTSGEQLQGSGTADSISAGYGGFPTPGVLSTAAQLTASGASPFAGHSIIESPSGIAIAPSGGTDYVAVQGGDPLAQEGSGIVTVDPASGAVDKLWSSNNFSPLANDAADEVNSGSGLSLDPASPGDLIWLDDPDSASLLPAAADFDVAEVPTSLSGSTGTTILASQNNALLYPDGSQFDADGQAIETGDAPPEMFDAGINGQPNAATVTAAPQVVALSNGLVAAVYEPDPSGQPDPESPSGSVGRWTFDTPGIRLLNPASDPLGLLSESTPPLISLVDTLGNTSPGSACSLTDAASATAGAPTWPSLQPGANGGIWVLTSGQDTSGAFPPGWTGTDPSGTLPAGLEGGRQLIELAPNATQACPSPSGTFTASAGSTTASGTTALTVPQGTTVSFDASGIAYPDSQNPAATDAYVWNFGDGGSSEILEQKDSAGQFQWPSPATTHAFTQVGDYTVSLTIYGDLGAYTQTGVVDVTPAAAPVASFTYSPASPQAGQSVTFDGSTSTAPSGSSITEYEWNFGDGATTTTSSPTATHSYSSAGTYAAKLQVLTSSDAVSTTTSQSITVSAPASTSPPGGGGGGGGSAKQPPSNSFTITKLLSAAKTGGVTAALNLPGAGTVHAEATFVERVTVKQKHHKVKHVTTTVVFGNVTKAVSAGGTTTLSISPSRSALSELKSLASHSSLSVTISITFTPTGGTAASHSGNTFVKGLKAAKKKKK